MGLLLFRLLSRLPFPVLHGLSDILYFLLAYGIRYRRRVIQTNLAQAFPEKTPAERQAILSGFYRNFADLIVETLKLPDLTADDLRSRTPFTNPEAVRPYLSAGKPVLIMASHQCNWEWAPSAAVIR